MRFKARVGKKGPCGLRIWPFAAHCRLYGGHARGGKGGGAKQWGMGFPPTDVISGRPSAGQDRPWYGLSQLSSPKRSSCIPKPLHLQCAVRWTCGCPLRGTGSTSRPQKRPNAPKGFSRGLWSLGQVVRDRGMVFAAFELFVCVSHSPEACPLCHASSPSQSLSTGSHHSGAF